MKDDGFLLSSDWLCWARLLRDCSQPYSSRGHRIGLLLMDTVFSWKFVMHAALRRISFLLFSPGVRHKYSVASIDNKNKNKNNNHLLHAPCALYVFFCYFLLRTIPAAAWGRPLLLRGPKVVFFGTQSKRKNLGFLLFFFGAASVWC